MSVDTRDKAQNLAELLGYDLDTSFKSPLQYIQSAVNSELSIAGKSDVKGGQTMVINIEDDMSVLCIKRTCVTFDITFTRATPPDNILALF